MNEIYETKISFARWMAYDLPGNAGWITYCVCAWRLLRGGAGWFAVFALIPALLMLVGVVELISERILKLDRVLPKARLWRGFGALTLGGALGMVMGVAGLVLRRGTIALWMLGGGALCALFAGLLFIGYKKR